MLSELRAFPGIPLTDLWSQPRRQRWKASVGFHRITPVGVGAVACSSLIN